jgi:hypothetical protein
MIHEPECDFYIFRVFDDKGASAFTVTDDLDADISISIITRAGEWHWFEDSPELLPGWCKHFHLTYTKVGYDLEDLGEPAVIYETRCL